MPVELGVYRAIVGRVSLESVMSLMMPVPTAVRTLMVLFLSSYVVMGMGCGKVQYSHRMSRLLVALQLAPVSPCIALFPVSIVVTGVGVDVVGSMVIVVNLVLPIREMCMVLRMMGLCINSLVLLYCCSSF